MGLLASLLAVSLSVAAPPQAAPLHEPYQLVAEPRGTLLVADGGSGRIVRVDPRTGARTVYAQGLGRVFDLEYGPGGLYVATTSRVLRIGATRLVLASGLRDAVGLAVDGDGGVYVVESAANRVVRIDPATRRRTVVAAAGLDQPIGVAVTADGTVFVSDSHHGRVVRIGAGGALELVRDGFALPAGLTASDNSVYVVDHVRHDAFGKIVRLRADGSAATISAGKIKAVTGVAVGRGGVIYATSFEPPYVGRLARNGALVPFSR